MAVNVVLTRKFFASDLEYIQKGVKEGANIIIPDAFTEDDLMHYAEEADIFLGPVISRRLCEVAKKLKFIQVPWTGVDNLNFDLINEIGVKVCNSHSNAYAVAEHAIALMFDVAKKVSYHDRIMRLGDWNRPKSDKSNSVSPFSKRVSGSQIGIIGYGHIGKLIKQYASALGCKFYVNNTRVTEKYVDGDVTYYPMTELKELLRNVDYVFLTVPLTPQTRGFFGTEEFASMKEDAIMINVSRGEIVEPAAMYDALINHKIAGVAMDTWYNNPKNPYDTDCKPSLEYPFETLDNMVLSPHRSAMIAGELPHLDDAIVNINRVVDGLEPINVVNIEKKF